MRTARRRLDVRAVFRPVAIAVLSSVLAIGVALAAAAPTTDQAEGNASEWGSFASDAVSHEIVEGTGLVRAGSSAMRLNTESGFDTGLTYPESADGHWDVTGMEWLVFWEYGENENNFQGPQPTVVLVTPTGEVRYEPDEQLAPNYEWRFQRVPLDGSASWTRTETGNPDLTDVLQIEIHHDTWDYGFSMVVDDLRFEEPEQNWRMKQRDMYHTGRADFEVPANRQGEDFFDAILWQASAPGSPDSGEIGSTQMTFFDGTGPGGADLVTGTYHWPKGIQGMDRWTGEVFWYGNPAGGESIAVRAGAFSADGQTIYITNDATPGPAPLMAFDTEAGPGDYWHNGGDDDPERLGMDSPVVGPEGRIFLHPWMGGPSAGQDDGTGITRVWDAATDGDMQRADVSLFEAAGGLQVIAGSVNGRVTAWDAETGQELWRTPTAGIRASVTIDPVSGNIFVPAGNGSTYIVGLDQDGNPLWGSADLLVYEHVSGVNAPHKMEADGALSHDGNTYYFATSSEAGDGLLYAIDTGDGRVKWTYPIEGKKAPIPGISSDHEVSAPIVTANGIVVVGNNQNDTFFAIRDDGTSPTLLDTLDTDPDDKQSIEACASASISPEGILYLPYRGLWVEGNPGASASFQVENLFTAIDLREDAEPGLYPPSNQQTFAMNSAVRLTWSKPYDGGNRFSHYAIYRDTAPFESVEGMTPIHTIDDIETEEYIDETALNGVAYHYAVTSVASDGDETKDVPSVGPVTPFDETDLQVVTVSRSPLYPRYAPTYESHEVTEPSGFGPYLFSSAMGLGEGQTADTQRWPSIGETVTYIATVRNRGTNTWSGTLAGTFAVDGEAQANPSKTATLEPGQTETLSFELNWDDEIHDIEFTLDVVDDRTGNNELFAGTKSVAFLSYVERGRIERFRERSKNYPGAVTDDFIDWLNHHMNRMNQMFADKGTQKRGHYDLLEVIPDDAPDPTPDRIKYAVFPFRYNTDDGNLREAGYYDEADDIDYGLLHEWAHQLGLIDIYRLNLGSDSNEVSGLGYSATPGLMNGVSHFFSDNSANAMTHWLHTAHGYYGQYLYSMPDQVRMRFLDIDGQPLSGATVRVFQKVERPGQGEIITDQVKNQGTTDVDGIYVLPNVDIDAALVPETYAGDKLKDNPFGYVHVVGNNGLLHFEIEKEGFTDYAWLEVLDVNNAYWDGQTEVATFERATTLGGEIQVCPLEDFTELNAPSWVTQNEDAAPAELFDDQGHFVVGAGSLRLETESGFDSYVRYPGDRNADWDLSGASHVRMWLYAENDHSFQRGPWVKLGSGSDYLTLEADGAPINDARGQWVRYDIPLEGGDGWTREEHGLTSLESVHYLEIHADTWDYGFTLWHDGVGFTPHGPGEVTGLLLSKGEPDVLSWDDLPDAVSYDIRRGNLLALTRTDFGGCLANDWATTTYEIPEDPDPARGYFYLVRGTGQCKGTRGNLGDGTPRIDHSAAACP